MPRDARHQEAQLSLRQDVLTKPKGPERDRAKRMWQAKYPEFEPCPSCTEASGNIRRRRGK